MLVALAATGGAWLLARRDDRVGGPARIAALALVGWCGAVAIAGLHGDRTPYFLWGALMPYGFALVAALALVAAAPSARRCAPRSW